MSGIFGIIHRDGRPVEARDLERMRDAMAHRGPDGSHIWMDGSAGLGQLMLCSTPESLNESLPRQDPESGLVITADARIDNRDELLRKLDIRPFRPQSGLPRSSVGGRLAADGTGPREAPIPDSQFILEAYKRWGEACVDHLLGDFAFAIWNPREKTLFCARDHMGIRPFYYFESESSFIFASSQQAVVSSDVVSPCISDERIADVLVTGLEGLNKRCTFYRGVWRLPPAHNAELSNRTFRISRFWKPDPDTEIYLGTDDEYTDALEEMLEESTKARLRTHRPPASMLSGGIDSSSIVGLAGRLLAESSQQLRTYSAISDKDPDCRESRNIRLMTSSGRFDSRLIRPFETGAFVESLRKVENLVEDPHDYHNVLLMLMYLAARSDGSVAVMDGLDGDGIASLPSAYPRYLIRKGRWIQANREIRGQMRHFYEGEAPMWLGYMNAIRPLLVPTAMRNRRWASNIQKKAIESIRQSFISSDLAGRVNLEARFREYYSDRGNAMSQTLRQAHIIRVMVSYLTAGIERYGRLAAYCGVEQRHPLLDKRVVEFCVALPWRQKVRNGWSKYTLRRLAERVAPSEIAWRRGWDAIGWKFIMSWHEIGRNAIDEMLQQELPLSTRYVDVSAWRQRPPMVEADAWMNENERAVIYLTKWLVLQRRLGLA